MDKKDTTYIKAVNDNCPEDSFAFEIFTDAKCTSKAAKDVKLTGTYKDLAGFSDIKFKYCEAFGDKWVAVNAKDDPPKVYKAKKVTKPASAGTQDKKGDPKKPDKPKNGAKEAAEKKKVQGDTKQSPYCKMKMTEYTGKDCSKEVTDATEKAKMAKAAKLWTKAAADFHKCHLVEGTKTVYEKIDCTKTGLTVGKYEDPQCTKPLKDKDGKEAKTTITWGTCQAGKAKSYKVDVDQKTVFAKYMAVGSASLLALIANQF